MLKSGISYVIGKEHSLFVGREVGSNVLNDCLSHLQKAQPQTVIAIDCKNVKFMDFSAADEFLRKLLNRIMGKELNNVYVLLTNVSPLARENISAALNLNKQVILISNSEKETEPLGPLHPQLKETWQLVKHKGNLTARDLADTLNIPINTSSNRLAKLARLGLIYQADKKGASGGGQEYLYECII